jgi:hypothetical protein
MFEKRRGCRSTSAVGALVLSVFAACGDGGTGPPDGLSACGSAPFLTVSPMALADIQQIAPLGNLNPPGHVFPTDHIYFYPTPFSSGTRSVPLVSPGNVTITVALLHRRSGGGQPNFDDYTLTFWACTDVRMVFAHVTTLAPTLAGKLGALGGSCDPSYQTGGFTFQQCRKQVNVELVAGEVIGTTGGPMSGGLDFTAVDRRITLGFVNRGRSWGASSDFGQNQATCALDYSIPSVADSLRARLGRPGARRTIQPVCGTHMQDVAGTAAGRWFRPNTENNPEDPHLALAHDNYNPNLAAFSVGTSVPSLPSGVYVFTPATSGTVNLDFKNVAATGTTYCYQTSSPARRILLMLVSSTRVRIQGAGSGPCGDPSTWLFGAGSAEFER